MLNERPLRWILSFLAIGCCSLFWSETLSVTVAFAYWCELAAQVAIIVLLFRADRIGLSAIALLKGYIFGACLVALIEWLSPTMSDLRPGDDNFFSPNAIGFTCAFGVFLAQYVGRSSWFWRAISAFLAVSLLRSLSKTTIVAFAISQGFLLLRDSSKGRKAKAVVTLATFAILWAFWGLIENYYVVYTHLGNQAETLSGRLGIWVFVLERSMERPWLGHGFHSFRNVIPPFGSFEAWHAHNELLQQFYTYGLLGIVLLGGVYGSFLRQIRRLPPSSVRTLFLAMLLFIFIRGLADTENFDLSLPLWSIAVFSLTLADERAFTPTVRWVSHPSLNPIALIHQSISPTEGYQP
jgi:O-antigen ligase